MTEFAQWLTKTLLTDHGIAITVLVALSAWLLWRHHARDKAVADTHARWLSKYEEMLMASIQAQERMVAALELVRERLKQ